MGDTGGRYKRRWPAFWGELEPKPANCLCTDPRTVVVSVKLTSGGIAENIKFVLRYAAADEQFSEESKSLKRASHSLQLLSLERVANADLWCCCGRESR